MIFRHQDKYTHPVLYMSANTVTQGKVKLKHVTNSFTQICQASGEGNLGKRRKT